MLGWSGFFDQKQTHLTRDPMFFRPSSVVLHRQSKEKQWEHKMCNLGLGEIGPEDPNFKIKTCTLEF